MTKLTDSQKKVPDLSEDVFRLNDLLAGSDKKILELRKENFELRGEVTQLKIVQGLLRESLLDAENIIEDLRGAAVQWRLTAAERKELNSRLQNEFAERSRLQKEATEREVLLREILNSTSWRISAPIRMLVRWLRKLVRANQKVLRPQRVAAEAPTVTRKSQFLGTGVATETLVDLNNPSFPAVSLTERLSENSLVSNVVRESVTHFRFLQRNAGKRLILGRRRHPANVRSAIWRA